MAHLHRLPGPINDFVQAVDRVFQSEAEIYEQARVNEPMEIRYCSRRPPSPWSFLVMAVQLFKSSFVQVVSQPSGVARLHITNLVEDSVSLRGVRTTSIFIGDRPQFIASSARRFVLPDFFTDDNVVWCLPW